MDTQADIEQPNYAKPYAGYPGRPLRFQDPEELQHKIDAYFADCDDNKKPYLIMGLCLWLDIDHRTLARYAKGEGDRGDFCPVIARARDRVLSGYEYAPFVDPRLAKHTDAMMERMDLCKPQPNMGGLVPGTINVLVMGADGARQVVSRDVVSVYPGLSERLDKQLPPAPGAEAPGP
jgi:hypothetical protein